MGVKIFVGVPHSLNFFDGVVFNPSIRKFTGGIEISALKADRVLNAEFETVEVGRLDGIPDFRKKVKRCDDYPEGYDIVVVSALYASAYRAKYGEYPASMRVVEGAVSSDDGKSPKGCRGLCVPL